MLVHINNLHFTLAAKYADFGILVFCLVGLFLVFLFTNVQYLFLARTICVLTEWNNIARQCFEQQLIIFQA